MINLKHILSDQGIPISHASAKITAAVPLDGTSSSSVKYVSLKHVVAPNLDKSEALGNEESEITSGTAASVALNDKKRRKTKMAQEAPVTLAQSTSDQSTLRIRPNAEFLSRFVANRERTNKSTLNSNSDENDDGGDIRLTLFRKKGESHLRRMALYYGFEIDTLVALPVAAHGLPVGFIEEYGSENASSVNERGRRGAATTITHIESSTISTFQDAGDTYHTKNKGSLPTTTSAKADATTCDDDKMTARAVKGNSKSSKLLENDEGEQRLANDMASNRRTTPAGGNSSSSSSSINITCRHNSEGKTRSQPSKHVAPSVRSPTAMTAAIDGQDDVDTTSTKNPRGKRNKSMLGVMGGGGMFRSALAKAGIMSQTTNSATPSMQPALLASSSTSAVTVSTSQLQLHQHQVQPTIPGSSISISAPDVSHTDHTDHTDGATVLNGVGDSTMAWGNHIVTITHPSPRSQRAIKRKLLPNVGDSDESRNPEQQQHQQQRQRTASVGGVRQSNLLKRAMLSISSSTR